MAKVKKSSVKKAQYGYGQGTAVGNVLRSIKKVFTGDRSLDCWKDRGGCGPKLGERIKDTVGKIRIPKRNKTKGDDGGGDYTPERTPRKPETVERRKKPLDVPLPPKKRLRAVVEQDYKDINERMPIGKSTPGSKKPSGGGAGKAKSSIKRVPSKGTPATKSSSQTTGTRREYAPPKVKFEEYRRGGKVAKRSVSKSRVSSKSKRK